MLQIDLDARRTHLDNRTIIVIDETGMAGTRTSPPSSTPPTTSTAEHAPACALVVQLFAVPTAEAIITPCYTFTPAGSYKGQRIAELNVYVSGVDDASTWSWTLNSSSASCVAISASYRAEAAVWQFVWVSGSWQPCNADYDDGLPAISYARADTTCNPAAPNGDLGLSYHTARSWISGTPYDNAKYLPATP